MLSFEEATAIVDGERRHQDERFPDRAPGGVRPLSLNGELTLLRALLGRADASWAFIADAPGRPGVGGTDLALVDIRRIAAVAVRCLEARGGPGATRLERADVYRRLAFHATGLALGGVNRREMPDWLTAIDGRLLRMRAHRRNWRYSMLTAAALSIACMMVHGKPQGEGDR